MTILADRVSEASEAFAANRTAMLAQLAAHDEQLALANAGGGPRYVERHRQRGKLLARERVEAMLDQDSPFLELSPLAAYGTSFPVGGGLVTGIGVVEGVECLLIANDPTQRGGATNPMSMRKNLRAMQIARENAPADDQPGRVRRRRPADAERDLHPRRPDVPRHHRHERAGASRRSPSCSATPPPAAPTCPG